MSEPTDNIPEFVLEKLDSYDRDQLDVITDYLLGGAGGAYDDLPEDFKPIVVMQDETTVEAIGEQADRMISGGADRDDLTGYEAMAQDIIDHARSEIGDELATGIARDVASLRLDDAARVQAITGNEQLVVEQLADRYIGYAGPRIKNAFADIADEYAVETPVNLSMNPFE